MSIKCLHRNLKWNDDFSNASCRDCGSLDAHGFVTIGPAEHKNEEGPGEEDGPWAEGYEQRRSRPGEPVIRSTEAGGEGTIFCRLAESSPKLGLCGWSEDEDGLWHTGCGSVFFFDSGKPDENKAKFCIYCGKPIDQIN